jgi:hypothetical protein
MSWNNSGNAPEPGSVNTTKRRPGKMMEYETALLASVECDADDSTRTFATLSLICRVRLRQADLQCIAARRGSKLTLSGRAVLGEFGLLACVTRPASGTFPHTPLCFDACTNRAGMHPAELCSRRSAVVNMLPPPTPYPACARSTIEWPANLYLMFPSIGLVEKSFNNFSKKLEFFLGVLCRHQLDQPRPALLAGLRQDFP